MRKAGRHLVALVIALLAVGCVRSAQTEAVIGTPVPALSTATPTMTAEPTLAPSLAPTVAETQSIPTPSPSPSHTATPTSLPSPIATATPTLVPSPSATATRQVPLPTTQPSTVRIQFSPGATSATLTGRLVRREEGGVEFGTEYLVRAFAGQALSVAITSPNNDVLLTIVGADGSPLKRYVDGLATWTGQLYATQDYVITPASVGKTTDYALAVSISAVHLLEPVRVEFGLGATDATVQGDLAPGFVARYVLRALRGQKLEASVAPATSISLAVEGQDGSFRSGPFSEGVVEIDTLPSTQDYVITLALVPAAETTHYTLEVTVVAGSGG